MQAMTPLELRNRLLEKRGYDTDTKQADFLSPDYTRMYDPFLMHDMEKSVMRIFEALHRNEKICIYSDYDADGIPGAVILHDFFKKIGFNNFWNYIPHRHTEGYGLHRDALLKISQAGTVLVITVDLGITAVAEVDYANDLGIEIIITDHHEPLEQLPNAYAIVNPKLGTYPDPMLCGAGVAFKLVQALLFSPARSSLDAAEACLSEARSAGEEREFLAGAVTPGWEKWLLDMAGLATLSDMVPLVNENRIIAYYGMKVLQKTKRPGLQSLFQKSGIDLRYLTETDIVFSITPKLNAASRMAHPEDAFKLLATTDRTDGLRSAEYLTSLNDERKKIVARIMREVHKKITLRMVDQKLPKILVIGDPTWSAGILGLVASKITESYNVTVFVWGSEENTIKGSCRGIGDVSVVSLMQEVSHLLTQFGGHESAGGFTTIKDQIHFLEDACNRSYTIIKYETQKQILEKKYDLELEITDVTMEHYYALRQLAPFGVDNPNPVFAFNNIIIKSVSQFGKTKEHLEIIIDQNAIHSGRNLPRAIKWYANAENFTADVLPGKTVTLLATFDHSVFRGKEELRLMIVDILD